MLNIQKVEINKNKNGEDEIGTDISMNLIYLLDTIENPYLLLKKYERKNKEFQDVGKFIYYMNVSMFSNKYFDNVQNDYFKTLKEFYNRKKQFSKAIANILKTDDN
jgi:hypothetical protein